MPAEFEHYFHTVRTDLAGQPMAPPDRLRRIGSRRTKTRRASAAAVVAAGVVVLAVGVARMSGGASSAPLPPVGPTQNTYAPSSAPPSDGATPTGPSTSSTGYGTTNTSNSSAPPSSTSTSTRSTTTAAQPCKPTQLSVTYGGGGIAMGHDGQVLLFQNTGSTTCRLRGYPAVWAVNAAGERIFSLPQTPHGYLGALSPETDTPPTVDVEPGQIASALLEREDPNVPRVIPCSNASTVITSIQILSPGADYPVVLPWTFTRDCGHNLQIHPFVPGTTGREVY